MKIKLGNVFLLLVAAASLSSAQAEPLSVLFVGNSYTFGRVDPVMSYNTANVRDLTDPMWQVSPGGSNQFEPHPWGGVAGIFKQLTVQAGLDYDVAISTRNAASLRGHLLNSNPAGWDMRGNIGSQNWDQIVLQEQSDEPLFRRPGLDAGPEYFRMYADRIEDFVHEGAATSYRERDYIDFTGTTNAERNASCSAATGSSTGSCGTLRTTPANDNANAATQMFLYQTWARPNLVEGAFVTTTDPITGVVTRTATPAATYFNNLESMTDEMKASYQAAFDQADDDGSPGFTGIAPVGEAFMRAVSAGVATRDMWAADATSDGLIDLWFDDGTHASKYGSYLSALTLFGTLTGLDPANFGDSEIAAFDLGISASDALALQRVASDQLGFSAHVPEPGALAMVLAGLGLIGAFPRRRKEIKAGILVLTTRP